MNNVKKNKTASDLNKITNEKNTYYILEYMHENVIHIVEKKLLEVMLVEQASLNSVIYAGWVENLGWHIGKDDKLYDRHQLNNAGLDYYKRVEIGNLGKNLIKALDEMNKSDNKDVLIEEKKRINLYFEKYFIKCIRPYKNKEMENENEETLSR